MYMLVGEICISWNTQYSPTNAIFAYRFFPGTKMRVMGGLGANNAKVSIKTHRSYIQKFEICLPVTKK